MSAEDMQRFEIEGGGSEVYGGVTICCDRCAWTSTLTTFHPHEGPRLTTLAELVQRAEEHTEVCR